MQSSSAEDRSEPAKEPASLETHSSEALSSVEPERLLDTVLTATHVELARAAEVSERPVGYLPAEISAMVLPEIIEQHAAEAAFLWQLRDRAVVAPHYSLDDLAKLDERVEAHLDGLREAGSHGWEAALAALSVDEPGEWFAVSALAYAFHGEWLASQVIAMADRDAVQRALVAGVAWNEPSVGRMRLSDWFAAGQPELRRLALRVGLAWRFDPGPILFDRLKDPDLPARARAMELASALGKTTGLEWIVRALSVEDARLRDAAARAAWRLGDRSPRVKELLRNSINQESLDLPASLELLLRGVSLVEAREELQRWATAGASDRWLVQAIGVLGDPAGVEKLLEAMQEPTLARVAGEALARITGVDLRWEDLDQDPPEPHSSDATIDAVFDAALDTDDQWQIDQQTILGVDGELAFPDVSRVTRWWQSRRQQFRDGERYLCGKLRDAEGLSFVLRTGRQRQRADAALELALADPQAIWWNVHGRGDRQLRRWEP